MNFEVISYGSGDFLRMVFTAIASIFGNADYLMAMKTSALLGFSAVLFKAAFDKAGMANIRWFIAMLVFYMMVVVPKETVIITDRITPSNSAVVAHVPLGLAATAGFFSQTGDYLARSFETIFSMPNQVRYSTNGLLFAHKVFEASRTMAIQDERTYLNFTEFFASCVVVDGIGQRRFGWDQVLESNNLIAFFESNVAVNAASFKYADSSGHETILPCRAGFSDHLKPDLLALNDAIMLHGATGFIAQTGSAASAVAKLQSDMQPAVQFLTGINQSANSSIMQNALINAVDGGVARMAQETNATEFIQNYAMVRAETERKTTYQAMGQIAEQKLPLLRALMEAFIYAIFPIVVLMAIVLPAKVSFAYLTTLIWINLWAPMYAIIHFAISYYSRGTMTALASMNGSGFTAIANTKMAGYVSDMAATAGYLAASLPLVAWMLVSRSGALAASFTNRVLQGYDSSTAQASEELTKGEGKFQGEKWEVTQSGQVQNTRLNDIGTYTTQTGGGEQFISQAKSSSQVGVQLAESVMQRSQQELSHAVQNEQRESVALTQANSAVLRDSHNVMSSLSKENGANNTASQSQSSSVQQISRELNNAAKEWAQTNGVELSSAAKASIFAGIEAGVGIKLFGKAQAGANIEGVKTEADRDSYAAAEKFLQSKEYAEAVSNIGQAAKTAAVHSGISQQNTQVAQLDASLSQQHTAAEEHSYAVSEVEAARESVSQAKELSQTLSVDGIDALKQVAINSGLSIGQFDQLLNQARHGNTEATDELRFMLVDAQMMGRVDARSTEDQQKILNTGHAELNQLSSSQTDQVKRQAHQWQQQVENKNTISNAQIKSVEKISAQSIDQTFKNTEEQLHKNSEAVDQQGQQTKHSVNQETSISQTSLLPGFSMALDKNQQ